MKKVIKLAIVAICIMLIIISCWLVDGGGEFLINYVEVQNIVNKYFSAIEKEGIVDYSLTTSSKQEKVASKYDLVDYKVSHIEIGRSPDESLWATADVILYLADGKQMNTWQELKKVNGKWRLVRNV